MLLIIITAPINSFFNKRNIVDSGINGNDLAVISSFTPKTNLTYRDQLIVSLVIIGTHRTGRMGHIIDLVITGTLRVSVKIFNLK
jgi:hypothetical protein